MIWLRRTEERQSDRRRQHEVWHTFHLENPSDALADGFGALRLLDEHRLPPGATLPRQPGRDAEVVSYVREGALAYEDSTGRSGVVRAGEFQCKNTGRNGRHSETNASRTDVVHVFQLCLRASEAGLEPGQEQKRFSAAERRGLLCVVASPDARKGSLRIHQDVLLYSALLDPGQHLVHELAQGRSAWLHMVEGEVTLGDVILSAGDGAGVTTDRAVSLTAREETEILLVDVGDPIA
jgi:quercetin 2,3-dioxygenase